jgi:amino acid permease
MLGTLDKLYFASRLALSYAKNHIRKMWEDERGGTATVVIEIVMVGMILVLGFIFRKAIADLFANLWNSLVVNRETDYTKPEAIDNPF